MDKFEKAYNENIKNNLTKQADEFYHALVDQTDRAKMPEDIFQHYFLPYFTNEQSISSNPEVISKWIGIAGTPMSEVDVINDHDEVIFTVPSLFDTTIINSSERKPGDSIADIAAEFDLKNNNLPVIAQNFLSKQLDRKLSIINKDNTNNHAREQWKAIFSRYGIQPTSVKEDEKTVDPSDDVEYD